MEMSSIKNQSDCVFCTIATSDAYCKTEWFSAIYNISPIVEGHSMIVPRFHAKSILELTDIQVNSLFTFARKVTAGLLEYFNCEAFDWSLQDGEDAGQTIGHLHLHIIPRKKLDLPQGTEWYEKLRQNSSHQLENNDRRSLQKMEYDTITQQLRAFFIQTGC